ncbi:Hypothetical predicted protein [Prunus dulcis]|uniref:Uncharacterized protein n=1 Tax=Prunus dulcis TaxID=3755 RepID=A0A5E4GH34_PRUDU|nr:Hypothetical predicted protein [Prunus dulcis]
MGSYCCHAWHTTSMPGQARLPSDSTQLECSKFEPKCKLAFLSNSATQPSDFRPMPAGEAS